MTRRRYFARGQLQFIAASTYHRAPLFASPHLCRQSVAVLEELRQEFNFQLLGWVLMPDHFHLLMQAQPAHSTGRIVQQLKQRTAVRILGILRQNLRYSWGERMLARLRLPPTVHAQAQFRVWQRRFCPFAIYTEKKRLEKLNYVHGNAVQRGLVSSLDQRPWSSFRFYHLNDGSVLKMDHPT